MSVARPTNRLFFAVLPDPETAAQVGVLARTLRQDLGLTGRPIAPEQLHVTLWHVGDSFLEPPPELISTLERRAGYVEMPSFRISFDHVMSFSGGAFVLRGGDGVSGLEMLRERLAAVLTVPGMKRASSTFTPHMTLLRGELRLPPRDIPPIAWTAREFVLVHSLLGRTTHRHLARLPLR